ncbi:hypothetical protein PDE_08793 [Penicillium oxalicum 114-2]|uniref:Uncharacterized protein n=1 Tax=Penicillium oxalicum (strain 114-2 / CGMCC 5302) TaxID=933388 RepID=S7ZYI2_PENO1|nr:hypothetical protein PDE_08793 [Penicillium oxalicum 114-2]
MAKVGLGWGETVKWVRMGAVTGGDPWGGYSVAHRAPSRGNRDREQQDAWRRGAIPNQYISIHVKAQVTVSRCEAGPNQRRGVYRQHLLRQTLPGLQIKQSCGLADDTRTEIDQSNLSLVRVTGLLVVLHEEIGITPAVGASRQRLSNCAQTGRLVSMFGLNIEITGNAILLQCTGEVFFGLQSLPHPAAEPQTLSLGKTSVRREKSDVLGNVYNSAITAITAT